MNFTLKGIGAQPKKLAILGGLALLLGYLFYSNVLAPSSDEPSSSRPGPARAAASDPSLTSGPLRPPETGPRAAARTAAQGPRQEFKLGLREKQADLNSLDPTLRLDLLAKLQSVSMAGGARNLFQFGEAPASVRAAEQKIAPAVAPVLLTSAAPAAAIKPPAPPIPLKFYGYAAPAPSGAKRVFFLDGDDIVVVEEGQVIKNRYKLVGIGINSVIVEDIENQSRQTLPIEEQKG